MHLKRFFFITFMFFLTVLSSRLTAENLVKVYPVQKSTFEYDFYADNQNYCPYQILVTIPAETVVKFSAVLPFYTVIKPQSVSNFLFHARIYSMINDIKLSVDREMGDPNAVETNAETTWLLPYENGTSYKVNQYYNTRFSHNGWTRYSIDFGLKQGTPVCASREGVVVGVEVSFSKGGLRSRYRDMANYITLYHNDGTFSQYFHLRKGGSTVKVGDTVRAGQIIGYSGNTGWTSGPHLHFMALIPLVMQRTTIPTPFYTPDGLLTTLRTHQSYLSYYPKDPQIMTSGMTAIIPTSNITASAAVLTNSGGEDNNLGAP